MVVNSLATDYAVYRRLQGPRHAANVMTAVTVQGWTKPGSANPRGSTFLGSLRTESAYQWTVCGPCFSLNFLGYIATTPQVRSPELLFGVNCCEKRKTVGEMQIPRTAEDCGPSDDVILGRPLSVTPCCVARRCSGD